ncbi:MAG: DUF4337 family protein [Fimbriiglobus sp.]
MADVEIPDPDEVKEKAENPFTRLVAFFVAIYAVALAFASLGGGDVDKDKFISKQEEARVESKAQQDEFNTWNRFQAKSIREALYRNERERLETEREVVPAEFNASPLKKMLLERAAKEEARMKADKAELEAEAKAINKTGKDDIQKIRDELSRLDRKDPYFEYGEMGLQLAIVLASISMIANKKWAFALSVVLALVSIVFTINGFYLLAKIPGIEH